MAGGAYQERPHKEKGEIAKNRVNGSHKVTKAHETAKAGKRHKGNREKTGVTGGWWPFAGKIV